MISESTIQNLVFVRDVKRALLLVCIDHNTKHKTFYYRNFINLIGSGTDFTQVNFHYEINTLKELGLIKSERKGSFELTELGKKVKRLASLLLIFSIKKRVPFNMLSRTHLHFNESLTYEYNPLIKVLKIFLERKLISSHIIDEKVGKRARKAILIQLLTHPSILIKLRTKSTFHLVDDMGMNELPKDVYFVKKGKWPRKVVNITQEVINTFYDPNEILTTAQIQQRIYNSMREDMDKAEDLIASDSLQEFSKPFIKLYSREIIEFNLKKLQELKFIIVDNSMKYRLNPNLVHLYTQFFKILRKYEQKVKVSSSTDQEIIKNSGILLALKLAEVEKKKVRKEFAKLYDNLVIEFFNNNEGQIFNMAQAVRELRKVHKHIKCSNSAITSRFSILVRRNLIKQVSQTKRKLYTSINTQTQSFL